MHVQNVPMQERIIRVAFDVRLFMGTPVQNRKIAHVQAAQNVCVFFIQITFVLF